MTARYFKRKWNESRGDQFDHWGHATYYFEVDDLGSATRQIEDYEHGPILRYSVEAPEDKYGGLATRAVIDNEADWRVFEISEDEFSREWEVERPAAKHRSSYESWVPEPIPEGWFVLPADRRESFVAELERELPPRHPLYGLNAVVVATCEGCDEILVHAEHNDGPRWSLVHLTWRGSRESAPWPITTVYSGNMPTSAMRDHAEHVTGGP